MISEERPARPTARAADTEAGREQLHHDPVNGNESGTRDEERTGSLKDKAVLMDAMNKIASSMWTRGAATEPAHAGRGGPSVSREANRPTAGNSPSSLTGRAARVGVAVDGGHGARRTLRTTGGARAGAGAAAKAEPAGGAAFAACLDGARESDLPVSGCRERQPAGVEAVLRGLQHCHSQAVHVPGNQNSHNTVKLEFDVKWQSFDEYGRQRYSGYPVHTKTGLVSQRRRQQQQHEGRRVAVGLGPDRQRHPARRSAPAARHGDDDGRSTPPRPGLAARRLTSSC